MKTTIICAAALSALLLSACHPKEQPEHVDKQQQGRDETQGIRNTEAVGYAGNAIADKVDAALDANDQAKQKMDDAIDAQTQDPH
ncbi:hypothetical protein [Solimonas terrae]|uniref:Lipoprotein n=1 Tax=Solimonas terrae TaxID=1396819 RepID=A0A6M2BR79_9GAMM|nr:hypothetical protein [Solimonas terrae]NGY04745.1 hypothetical protein [Solimonas terrae]